MAWNFYVYYRIDPPQAAAAEPQVRALLDEVKKTTGVEGRLMKKRDEPHLWMEVYEGVADDAAFDFALADAVGRLGVMRYLVAGSGRHTECFSD